MYTPCPYTNLSSLQNLAPFDYYFAEIDKIISNKTVSSRVRFMLQDLVDLRRNDWRPRREAAGPKTIQQVRTFTIFQVVDP